MFTNLNRCDECGSHPVAVTAAALWRDARRWRALRAARVADAAADRADRAARAAFRAEGIHA